MSKHVTWALLLAALAGCPGSGFTITIKTDFDTTDTDTGSGSGSDSVGGYWGDGSGEVATFDNDTGRCTWSWYNQLGYPGKPLHSLCILGAYPETGAPPANMQVTTPCAEATNPIIGLATNTDSDSGSYIDELTNGGADVCPINQGIGTWTVEFDGSTPECDGYTKDSVFGVYIDDGGQPYSDGLCAYFVDYGGEAYARMTYPRVASSGAACMPGTATFRMVDRKSSASGHPVWLAPIAETQAQFPERAWLRRVEVTDWGTLDNLHVAGFQHHLDLAPGAVGGRVLTAPTSVMTFAAGEAPMSTMFVSDGVTLDAATKLPEVRLSWSCEFDPAHLHFQSIGNGFVGAPLAPIGSPQRVVLWMDWANQLMRIAPEGEFVDYVRVQLHVVGPRLATFTAKLPTYGATVTGVVRQVDNTVYVTAASVRIGDSTMALPDTSFAAFGGGS